MSTSDHDYCGRLLESCSLLGEANLKVAALRAELDEAQAGNWKWMQTCAAQQTEIANAQHIRRRAEAKLAEAEGVVQAVYVHAGSRDRDGRERDVLDDMRDEAFAYLDKHRAAAAPAPSPEKPEGGEVGNV